MFSLTLKGIQNVFFASFNLLFKPKTCFVKEDDDSLTVSNINGFIYWIYLTLATYSILLLTSNSADLYTMWYFFAGAIYSLVRIFIFAILWIMVSSLFGFKNFTSLLSILFFGTGLFSFIHYLVLIPFIDGVGIETVLKTGLNLQEHAKELFIFIFISIVTFTYQVIWISTLYKIKYIKAFFFLLSVSLLYGIFRPILVLPFMEFIQNFLLNTPWKQVLVT